MARRRTSISVDLRFRAQSKSSGACYSKPLYANLNSFLGFLAELHNSTTSLYISVSPYVFFVWRAVLTQVPSCLDSLSAASEGDGATLKACIASLT